MIEFLTLVLGLVTGPHPVALAVEAPVVAVELRLDGAAAGHLDAEPWEIEIDFGDALLPHHLEAVGLDAEGSEVVRVEQWINLPRPQVEARLILEPAADAGSGRVRFHWQSATVEDLALERISWRLDGEPLAASGVRLGLPALAREDLHFVEAEAVLSDGRTAYAELIFGGRFGDEVASELTPVRVALAPEAAEPTAAGLATCFTAAGSPVPVVAVESDPGELLLVRDGSVPGLTFRRLPRSNNPTINRRLRDRRIRALLPLTDGQRVRLVLPHGDVAHRAGNRFDVFPLSPSYEAGEGGLFHWLMVDPFGDQVAEGEPRLADATAVAGVRAYGARRPVVVVLVPGSGFADDASAYPPAAVAGYLESLGVPLRVWSFDRKAADAGDWPDASPAHNIRQLGRALAEAEELLARQRLVWIEGRHLPQQVAVEEGCGVALSR